MFLEKYHRFVRHYRFSFNPRKRNGVALPLFDAAGGPSVFEILSAAVGNNKALDVRPNGDIIEMMSIEFHKPSGAIVALLHRASPNAADPMYRRKARRGYDLRKVERAADEEQSVSAHLIILPAAVGENSYDAILEEIPGLSMSLIQPVIGKPLRDASYTYQDSKGHDQTTYATFKPQGVKSETVTNALKTGHFGYIVLSRPAEAKFIDSEDIFEPIDEKMKIKVKGKVEPAAWMDMIGSLAMRARESGWPDFQIDIELDDERMRRIPIARGQEAKEILFIRSAEVNVKDPLEVCSNIVVDEFVKNAIAAI